MVLGLAQSLTESSNRRLPGDNKHPERKAGNLTVICVSNVQKTRGPRRITILWASAASSRDS
jgi:hypothetical protein